MEVAHEVARLLALAGGAHDDAHPLGDRQLVDELLQALALLGVLDLARDAAAVAVGGQDQVAAGDREVRRRARALGADRALGHLDHDVGAGRIEAGDVLDGQLALGGRVPLLVHADDLDRRVGRGGKHVPVVEEGVLRVADVDERRLEAGVQVLDPALVDAADHPVVGLALDLELLEAAVDEERHALLQRLGIDDELAVRALLLLEGCDDLLEKRPLLGALRRAGLQLCRADGCDLALDRRTGELGIIFLSDVVRGRRGWVAMFRSWGALSWLESGLLRARVAAQEIPAERSISRVGRRRHAKSFRKR